MSRALRVGFLLALFWLVGAFPVVSAQDVSAEDLKGRFEVVDGQRTLSLWGTPRERGFAQGYLLGEVMVGGFDADLRRLLRIGLPLYEMKIVKDIVPAFGFDAAEMEELEGMLAGLRAKVPPERRVVKALGREIGLDDLKAINTVGDWTALACSTIALSGELTEDGAPMVARNFDFGAFSLVLEHQMAVVVRPDQGFGYAGVSYPGCIGVITGMNEQGVFASIHDVMVMAPMATARRANVPRLLALRRIVRDVAADGAVERAHELATSWPTLYGNNFMIVTANSGRGGAFAGVLEYDHRRAIDGGATLRTSSWAGKAPEPFLVCTNHHRVRGEHSEGPEGLCERYDALTEGARAYVGGGRAAEAGSAGEAAGPRPAAAPRKLGLDSLVALGSVAAVPKPPSVQRSYRHGTLHQAFGLLGARKLVLRLGEPGKNIREVGLRTIEVPAAVAALPAPAREPVPAGK